MGKNKFLIVVLLGVYSSVTCRANNQLALFNQRVNKINQLQSELFQDFPVNVIKVYAKNNILMDSLSSLLSNADFYDFNYDSLKNFYIINGPENQFRVITWMIEIEKNNFAYYGFTQYKLTKNKIKVYNLEELNTWEGYEYKTVNHKNWLGCVYYAIVPKSKKNDANFILLGWNGNGSLTKKKIIEVLNFNSRGEPIFGKDIFESTSIFTPRGKKLVRIILEYSSRVSIGLNYDKNMGMIVYDHLSPTDPRLKNVRAAYVPDFSFDAFKYERGKWIHKEDVDAKNMDHPKVIKYDPKDYHPKKQTQP